MFEGFKTKRKISDALALALTSLYGDQLDFEFAAKKVSLVETEAPEIILGIAAELNEPPAKPDISNAIQLLEVFRDSNLGSRTSCIARAKVQWQKRLDEIAAGRDAYEKDENSFDGMVYGWQFSKRAPLSSSELLRLRVIFGKLENAQSNLEEIQKERENYNEYQKLKKELDQLETLKEGLDRLESDPVMMQDWGWMYIEGDGVEKDYSRGVEWIRKAAELGLPSAQHNLGIIFEDGKIVSKDIKEARKWYLRAAQQGNAESQNNLGVLCEQGDGVTKNLIEAARWYRKAAEGSSENAKDNLIRLCLTLVRLYLDGEEYPLNPPLGYCFASVAGSNGSNVVDELLNEFPAWIRKLEAEEINEFLEIEERILNLELRRHEDFRWWRDWSALSVAEIRKPALDLEKVKLEYYETLQGTRNNNNPKLS